MDSLARFYANPRTVRVSLRYSDPGWIATVTVRSNALFTVLAYEYTPEFAVFMALKKAESEVFPGVDLGLGWAYEHPQKETRK